MTAHESAPESASLESACSPPSAVPGTDREQWMLDPSIVFLNHGSFGARLRSVVERQQAHRLAYEARPVEWIDRRRDALLGRAKEVVGDFLGMQPASFGFVTNASAGINAVLRSLPFDAGDEIVTTSHVYNAVRQTMRWVATRTGAVPIEVELPVPIASPGDVVDAMVARFGPATRLVVIDHVTSPTGLILPIDEIIQAARDVGALVLVDGAHAPGMLPLDVTACAADFYAGNLHKWVGAPSGAGFLHVAPEHAASIHPVTISHFLGEGLASEFAWQGTRDITPWLAAADAIELMGRLGGHSDAWPALREHGHALARWARSRLQDAFGVEPIAPNAMIGTLATVRLPDRFQDPSYDTVALQAELYDADRIEVPIIELGDTRFVRVSAAPYNRPHEYEALADAVASRA